MAYDLNALIIDNDPVQSPPRITIYSDEGMGKTTMASQAPNPIFMRAEDGEGILKIKMLPMLKDYQQMMGYLGSLCEQEHNFMTLAVDSLDHIEPLIWNEICRLNNWTNEEALKYGRGHAAALDLWRDYIDTINFLRNQRKMIIIQLAHAKAKPYQNPETEVYDRFDIKLNAGASALIKETSDIVFFINDKVNVAVEDTAFNQKRKRAVGGANQRFLYSENRPASGSKNRYNLPAQIEFDREGRYWNTLAQHIPFLGNLMQPAQTEETQTNQPTE